jgi:PPOX class probable F420-dependent enzyme
MSALTPAMRTFLDEQLVGVMGTVDARGRARQSVVYYVRDGDRLLVSSETSRWKAKDVRRDGWASLCILGHERPFPALTVAGPAEVLAEDIGPATARVVQRMMGLGEPPEPQTDEALAAVGRIILVITVERVGPVNYLEAGVAPDR